MDPLQFKKICQQFLNLTDNNNATKNENGQRQIREYSESVSNSPASSQNSLSSIHENLKEQFVDVSKDSKLNENVVTEKCDTYLNEDLSCHSDDPALEKTIFLPYHDRHAYEAKQFAKEILIQTSAGAVAGVIEICSLHPLDVIKTRFQIQTSVSQIKYDGLVDCFRKMYKQEGLSSFYKGITPPILMETPRRAIMFLTFEQYKKLFSLNASDPHIFVYFLAGAAAGATDSLLSNPFEVVKVSLQTEIGRQERSAYNMTKQIINEGGYGMKGINKGLDAIVFRNAVFSCTYFGLYNTIIKITSPMDTKNKEFLRKVFVSTLAGVVGTCLVTPSDVIKSKIQGKQPHPPAVKYKFLIPAFLDVFKESGWRGLYKGFLPKVLRLGPGGAILMLIYESVNKHLYAIL